MATVNAKIITANSVSIVADGKSYVATASSHTNYTAIRDALKNNDYDLAVKLFDTAATVNAAGKGRITVKNGEVLFKGQPLQNGTAESILKMIGEGFDASDMLAFLDNLMDNPSFRSIQQIGRFQEACNLPITSDGYLIGWKRVREDFKDYYTGSMDNRVGQVVEMPRNEVNDNPDETCSNGLHFCSESYLDHYHGGRGKIIMIKINPRDIVSIPTDYNNAKGRCCRYEVIAVVDGVPKEDHFDKSIVTDEEARNSTKTAPKSRSNPNVSGPRFNIIFEPADGSVPIIYESSDSYITAVDQFKEASAPNIWTNPGELYLKDQGNVIAHVTVAAKPKAAPVKAKVISNPGVAWPFPADSTRPGATNRNRGVTPAPTKVTSGPQLVTKNQAAAILGLTVAKIDAKIANGELATKNKHGRPYVLIK